MTVALENPEEESVLIIGGGVIGIACAHYLNEAGYCVTVIDQGSIANACSYGNCGFVCPSHILPVATPLGYVNSLKFARLDAKAVTNLCQVIFKPLIAAHKLATLMPVGLIPLLYGRHPAPAVILWLLLFGLILLFLVESGRRVGPGGMPGEVTLKVHGDAHEAIRLIGERLVPALG